MTKPTLEFFALEDLRYLLLHMQNVVAYSIKCLNVLDSLLFFGPFLVWHSSEIKSVRESSPNLMCLAVPSNKSSFLQRPLGVLLHSDLET